MELIDVLRSERSAEGLTTAELLEQMGLADTAFYRRRLLIRLKSEVKSGRVVCEQAIRTRIDGRPTKAPVYRVKG